MNSYLHDTDEWTRGTEKLIKLSKFKEPANGRFRIETQALGLQSPCASPLDHSTSHAITYEYEYKKENLTVSFWCCPEKMLELKEKNSNNTTCTITYWELCVPNSMETFLHFSFQIQHIHFLSMKISGDIPMNFILMCVADSVFWLNSYFSLLVVAFLYYRGQRTQQHSLESPAALVQACDLSFLRHIFTKCQCGNEQCDFFSPEWKFRFPDKVEGAECPSGAAVMEQCCFC